MFFQKNYEFVHFHFIFLFQNETRVLVTEEEVIEDASQNPTQEETETIFVDMTTTTPEVTSQNQDDEEDEGKSQITLFTCCFFERIQKWI